MSEARPGVSPSVNQTAAKSRLDTIDVLRGIASLSVVVFHSTFQLPEGALKHAASFGALGVQVFFVISGFILPYSLDRAKYDLSSYFRFVARRVMRLDPPYLVSVLFTIALFYIGSQLPGYRGSGFELSWSRLLLHVGYLNGLVGVEWYSVVYWTLAIEFQYYLLIGLLFPLVASRNRLVATAILFAMGLSAALIRNESVIFYWLLPFMLGMIAFQLKTGRIGLPEYALRTLLTACATYYYIGPSGLVASLSTALVIAFVTIRGNRVTYFLGAISYSLYLVHVPVSGRVVNIGNRFVQGYPATLIVSLIAIGAAIAAAYILYVAVERPAQRWASAMSLKRYTPRSVDPTSAVERILPGGP